MYKLLCAALLISCAFKTCNAFCSYNNVGAKCIFLDTDSSKCNQCTTSSDDLINAVPNSIDVQQYKGACGCVVIVNYGCINLLSIIPPTFLSIDCNRRGQTLAGNIVNNEPCGGCDVVNSAPAPAQDAPTSFPTTPGALTPTTKSSVSTPAPNTPTTPTTQSQTSTSLPKGGGVGCIADYQSVVTTHNTTTAIRDLKPGDMVVTDEGLQEYIGNIHEGSVLPTIVLHTASSSIEITGNHLVKTKSSEAALMGFSHASDIIVGDFIVTGKVVRITHATSFVSSPLTRSGTIIVNNVVLSCYASVYSHQVAKISTYPLRIGAFKDIQSYFRFLIYIHNLLPQFAQRLITNF